MSEYPTNSLQYIVTEQKSEDLEAPWHFLPSEDRGVGLCTCYLLTSNRGFNIIAIALVNVVAGDED